MRMPPTTSVAADQSRTAVRSPRTSSFSRPRLIAAAARVTFRVTKWTGRRGDSWLKRIADDAWRPWRSRTRPTSWWTASLATPYGVFGWQAVDSSWGLDGGLPKISRELATTTRAAGVSSRTASSSSELSTAIARTVPVGSSQLSGTKVGAARW